jgi:hypothetical protein
MKPLRRNAVAVASSLGLDVETNSPTPVDGVELSTNAPLHRTHNPNSVQYSPTPKSLPVTPAIVEDFGAVLAS